MQGSRDSAKGRHDRRIPYSTDSVRQVVQQTDFFTQRVAFGVFGSPTQLRSTARPPGIITQEGRQPRSAYDWCRALVLTTGRSSRKVWMVDTACGCGRSFEAVDGRRVDRGMD